MERVEAGKSDPSGQLTEGQHSLYMATIVRCKICTMKHKARHTRFKVQTNSSSIHYMEHHLSHSEIPDNTDPLRTPL